MTPIESVLPGLPDHGDLVDYIEANPGTTADDLMQMAEAVEVVEAPAEQLEAATPSGPVVVRMSDVEPRRVSWLWPSRIPAGRITLLVGKPGCGKSFFTLDSAARITTGRAWPDGSDCPQGDVVLISAEDDPHDTIRPRLDAHYADPARVHMLKAVTRYDPNRKTPQEVCFTLEDVAALEQVLEGLPQTKLIIIDPIGSYLGGGTDAHRDNEVRAILAPVAMLAERYGAAVLIIAHRRKAAGTSADDLALGSRGFTGIARSVLHLCRDPQDKARRLLLPGKCNLSAPAPGLAFGISGYPPSLLWEPDPVDMDADELLALENAAGTPGPAPESQDEAKKWLTDVLADGPVESCELKKQANQAGLSWSTVKRARLGLKIVVEKRGFNAGGWQWRFLTPPAEEDQVTPPEPGPLRFSIAPAEEDHEHLERRTWSSSGEPGPLRFSAQKREEDQVPSKKTKIQVIGENLVPFGGMAQKRGSAHDDPDFGPDIDDDLPPPEIRFAGADEAAAEIEASPWGVMAVRDEDGLTAVERAERYRTEQQAQ